MYTCPWLSFVGILYIEICGQMVSEVSRVAFWVRVLDEVRPSPMIEDCCEGEMRRGWVVSVGRGSPSCVQSRGLLLSKCTRPTELLEHLNIFLNVRPKVLQRNNKSGDDVRT